MSNSIIIEIDGKPVAKGRGRIGNVKRKDGTSFSTIFTPKQTVSYENLIKLAAGRAMGEREPFEGAVKVWVHAYLAYPKTTKKKLSDMVAGRLRPCSKPDLDNYVKSALDGLNTIVFRDDNQVVSLYAHKVYRSKPALRIEVRECCIEPDKEESPI